MSSTRIISKVFVGCCLSTTFMEIIVVNKPDAANLVTFSQFLSIALQGLLTMRESVLSPNIPLKHYLILICLFFATSVANNYVYTLHVPSTLHMIIRSAASPASMLVSWYVKRKKPKLNSLIGSIIITFGVFIATYGDATIIEKRQGKFFQWCMGVILLLMTLISGAFTGLQQEIFKNSITIYHIVGSVLVFIGTYFYFDFFYNMKQHPVKYKKK
ncbi:unnamed protein product [Leptidea sinapis]|uniref:Sugar phosphate transporter domain-containing protein n=1 Tax=Leptidea sinapis TaxID=189913 RepID=A0A5E4QN31_9NEOP|nr:unnamed protein product [Leptidea sinapis]